MSTVTNPSDDVVIPGAKAAVASFSRIPAYCGELQIGELWTLCSGGKSPWLQCQPPEAGIILTTVKII